MRTTLSLLMLIALACGKTREPEPPPEPVVLLITLDTTRADHLPPHRTDATPNLARLAQTARVFEAAYTTAPQTLPAHTSMMSGTYPSEHGIHENARYLAPTLPLLAERLEGAGWQTRAVVSAYPLAGEFGLSRGFDRYDDRMGEASERIAEETTNRALALLDESTDGPLLIWVHYFDPHAPYRPPAPFSTRFPEDPYTGEIAYMDEQLGRLLTRFESLAADRPHRILVVGDHGEGLGEKGEAQHGNLLYEGVVRVPLMIAGHDLEPGSETRPVSIRRVYDTVLGFAGIEAGAGLEDPPDEVVLAEAMKPFLQYGWSPQAMAVDGNSKMIRTADTELYDLRVDGEETNNLIGERQPSKRALRALSAYPVPGEEPNPRALDQDQLERLASLGYSASPGIPEQRTDAPAPRAMTDLFPALDRASDLFVKGDYRAAATAFEAILTRDPGNLTGHIRLAVCHSLLGEEQRALDHFRRAGELSASSIDLIHYLGMHYLRFGHLEKAADRLEAVLRGQPRRVAALSALARVRTRQNRAEEAIALLGRAATISDDPGIYERMGILHMGRGKTTAAITAFEQARALAGPDFGAALDLGVCYMAVNRFAEAAELLETVTADDPRYPMALFKRAQAAVLIRDPEAGRWIELARANADETTRPMIESEKLFEMVVP